MTKELLPLWIILGAGVLGKNHYVTIAASILILLSLTGFTQVFPYLQRNGIDIGVTMLILTVMIPFATNSVNLNQLASTVTGIPGTAAILIGMASAVIAARGVELLKDEPGVLIGLVIGSLIGTSFFKGIPAGPLVAAGLTALLVDLLS